MNYLKNTFIFLVISILSILSPSVLGDDSVDIPSYELQRLDFSNRARCSADSSKPSRSAFLLLNNVDPARAVYRLAQARGEDPRVLTPLGIDVFRSSVIRMVNLIHHRLNTRELPLLPATLDSDDRHVPSRYRRVMQSCQLGEYCEALDEYIADIWDISSSNFNAQTKFLKFYDVDNYHSQENYLWEGDYHRRVRGQDQLSCAYLKKFSPLQANLYGIEPNAAALTAIGQSVLNQDEYLARCDDFDQQEDLQVAVYQLDLPEFRRGRWDRHGHDYWNSLRLYLSWAYRFAPEMDQMAFPFTNVFRSVAIEDAVLLTPNGCKSLSPPACDNDRLAINSIREFAKNNYRTNALNLDIMRSVPDGPQQDLLDSPIPSINTDILDLADHSSASDWLNQFRENMSATRNHHRTRLIRAFSQLNLITSYIGANDFVEILQAEFSDILSPKSVGRSLNDQRNRLYYLCSEFSFSQHETWSLIKSDLDILRDYQILDGISQNISGNRVSEYYSYLELMGENINSLCYSLNQRNVWDDDFKLERTGFAPWYIDRVYDNKYESSFYDDIKNLASAKGRPFISLNTSSDLSPADSVICTTASDCARLVVQSIIDIYSVSQYASAMWSLERKIKAPDMFNPYNERTSCQVYDPWYKTKSSIFNLVWDLGQATVSAFTPGMVYTSATLSPRTVTSFNQLVENGQIHYDRNINEQSVVSGLAADFGPLLGVPCSVSVNQSHYLHHDYLMFAGVSVGACTSNEDHNIFAQSGSNIGDNDSRTLNSCMACTLNFETLSGTAAYLSQNVGPVYFFVRGIYRLYRGLTDPLNIPRSWEVYPQDVAETLLSYGEIPDHCVRDLRRGRSCLRNVCEQSVADRLKRDYPRLPNYISEFDVPNFGSGKAYIRGCSEPITFRVRKEVNHNNFPGETESCHVSRLNVPSSCLNN